MDGESIVFYGAYQGSDDDWQDAISRINLTRWEHFDTLATELDLHVAVYGSPNSDKWMIAAARSLRAACLGCEEVVPLRYVEASPTWKVHILTYAEAAGIPIADKDIGWWLTVNVASA